MSELNIDRVNLLLRELAERLNGRGIEGEIYVVGGVAMMLAYDRTRTTQDIDAVGIPQEEIDKEVAAMATDHKDLGPDWLNARVLPLLPRKADPDRLQVMGAPGLTVNVASAKWMIAMKARAARGRRDFDDIWILCQVLNLRAIEDVWNICTEVWGEGMITEEAIATVTADLQARGLR